MALYTIADLHLSLGENTDKPMEVFGAKWQDHADKIKTRWTSLVSDADTVIIPGDISWALKLEDSLADFLFIESLPGKKIISKGNHDFWWSTQNKIKGFFSANKIETIDILYNNAYVIDDTVVCGTRGWYNESSAAPRPCDYEKISARECGRLERSLASGIALTNGRDIPIVAFTHFPPVWKDFAFDELVSVMEKYGVKKCYYGHIHGVYNCPAVTEYRSIRFELISADFIDFTPRRIFIP
jgi:predicted phosphohydrolase